MTQLLIDERTTSTSGGDDNLDHIVCCDKDEALCGKDVTDAPWGDGWRDDDTNLCVVCVDLAYQPSPCCGGVVVR